MSIRWHVSRSAVLALFAYLAFGVAPTPVAARGCASSQGECTQCCVHAAYCCGKTGGTLTGECEYSPGSCTLPGCFGGSQECDAD
jgi:hypothetical protein